MSILERPSSSFSFPSSNSVCERDLIQLKPSSSHLPLHHQRTTSSTSLDSFSAVMQQQHGPLHRRDAVTVTDSTMFSVSTTPANGGNPSQQKRKKSIRSRSRRFKLGGFLKRAVGGRKRPLSETQLRKKLKKAAEKGDWEGVRKLLSNHDFSDTPPDIPEAMPKTQEEPATGAVVASRRPSYGSRERRSFTGGESAAAAAVIKAAALEESSGSPIDIGGCQDSGPCSSDHRTPDIGENILHDVCRYRPPPLDVLETLLAALRHRRGCTSGTDCRGRTPLHLAAMSGAAPELIDALIRADPTPATMGDDDRRSPLHLAMKYLVSPALLPNGRSNGKNVPQEKILSPTETLERTFHTVQILKDAMLTYPGRIDFKDEDSTGFSPLDYAIDGNISKEELIQTLIRRKESRCRRSSHRAHGIPRYNSSFQRSNSNCGRSIYSIASSVTEDIQDIEILRRLEQDEIEARTHRIETMRAQRQKARMNDALFDVFGIEEQPSIPVAATKPFPTASPPKGLKSSEDDKPLDMTEDDIYDQHLQDYLHDYMDDFEGGDLEYFDEDGFDIFEDPEEVGNQQDDAYQILKGPPLAEIIFTEDDDCVSLFSEVRNCSFDTDPID